MLLQPKHPSSALTQQSVIPIQWYQFSIFLSRFQLRKHIKYYPMKAQQSFTGVELFSVGALSRQSCIAGGTFGHSNGCFERFIDCKKRTIHGLQELTIHWLQKLYDLRSAWKLYSIVLKASTASWLPEKGFPSYWQNNLQKDWSYRTHFVDPNHFLQAELSILTRFVDIRVERFRDELLRLGWKSTVAA